MLYTFHNRKPMTQSVNHGFYQSLSGKRALAIFRGLQEGDRRLGTHRAARFAMAFEDHGNATSVACFMEMVAALEDAGDMGGHERSFQQHVITYQRPSVVCGPISHVHARPLRPAASRRILALVNRALAMVSRGRLIGTTGHIPA